MAHGMLFRIIALHPRATRLKAARRAHRVRPIRPSKVAELQYRVGLRNRVVEQCRQAGDDIAAGMRSHWPAAKDSVRDSVAPGLDSLLQLAAMRFGNIDGVADALAKAAALKTLGGVDEKLAKSLERALGVDLTSYLGPTSEIAGAMSEAVTANVALIKSIPVQYLDKVKAAVEKSFADGQRWEVLAKEIKRIGDVTDARARLIARDQVSKMTTSFNGVRQMGLGIDRYTWSTAHDERVRRSHGALNGTTQAWKSPPIVDGEPAHPGQPINCRCVPIPVISFDEVAPYGDGLQQEAA